MLQLTLKKSFTCMNHMFLSHAVNDNRSFGNDLIEGELYFFFSSLEEDDLCSEFLLLFNDSLEDELKILLDDFSINDLRKGIEESLYIIMGYNSTIIQNIFMQSLDNISERHLLPS